MAKSAVIVETPVKKSVYSELLRFSRVTQLELKFDPDKHDAKETVKWVDDLTYRWQQTGKTPPKKYVSLEDLPLLLGFVWGEQIVAAHGWKWVSLEFRKDKWSALAVVSKDRSLMILPFAFVRQCVAESIDVTIAASLAVIGTNVIPRFPPKTYKDLMQGLRRIVPR